MIVAVGGMPLAALAQPKAVPQPGNVPVQPGVQPGAQPAQPGSPLTDTAAPATSGAAPASITNEAGEITLSVFSDPVDLTTLIDLVVKTLNINVTIKGALTGNVTFNAPVSISKDRLMPLVDALLEQQNYTIHLDNDSGFYVIEPISDVGPVLVGERPSTRIIATPGIRPSALRATVDSQFGGGGGGGGVPGAPQGGGGGGGAAGNVAYLDEMGVIVATGTQRKLEAVQSLVQRLMAEYQKAKFRRFDLKFVAAPVARERALQLVGQSSQTRSRGNNNPDNPQPEQPMPNQGAGGSRAAFDNIAERLTVDPQGNALMFRGVDDEIDRVTEILELIDVRSDLLPKKYVVGNAAQQIADIAKQRGLGDITTIEDTSGNNSNRRNNFYDPYNNPRRNQAQTTSNGGPVMVVDEKTGTIIYYGTEEQQKQLSRLVEELQLESDKVTVRTYKLRHAKAEQVAEIVLGLLQNRQPAGQSSLTSGAGGTNNNSNNRNNRSNTGNNQVQPVIVNNPGGFFDPNSAGGSTEGEFAAGPDTFVLADTLNNQVLVKAPTRQQAEFERIIQKIDLRRPQVLIEARIVAVSWTDDMRLAFESQFTNIGDFGGVLNTNFGLGSFGTGTGINGVKTVNNSSGLTAALIKSQDVPIIINALQQKVNTKILSSPQLLVDDNEEAELKSKNEQPTTTSTQGTSTTNESFGGYEEAGTNLKVTPRISDAGYVGLQVTAELSSFAGNTNNGIPPPRDTNTLTTNSVSVPTDMTVVIGGLQFDSKTNDRTGIPLLMDIPVLGALFRDENDNMRKSTLYIFLTPRVIRDPNFEDLRLLTKGPQTTADLPADLPPIKPQLVEIISPDAIKPSMDAPKSDNPPPVSEPAATPSSETAH
jgi:type II secretion system protein D